MTVHPSITFVCCVESGGLEAQTVRMIESLRRWGGRFADAPIFAVTPRFGPPLGHKTHRAFERLHVEYLRFHAKSRYLWYGPLNKPYAVVAVEERSTSESICWLDSDLLFVGEPDQLILNEGEDFLACAPDKNIGTSGPEDPFDPYWKEVCKAVGMNIEDLPWITEEQEGQRIRLYWNSGLFVYRRSTSFANQYLQTCTQIFDAHITSNYHNDIFFHEQLALALAMVKMGLSWRALPFSYNYPWVWNVPQWYNEEQLKAATIIHAHGVMWPNFWSEFMKCLRDTHPTVADWIFPLGPLKNDTPIYWKTTGKVLQYFRSKQRSAHVESCQVIQVI